VSVRSRQRGPVAVGVRQRRRIRLVVRSQHPGPIVGRWVWFGLRLSPLITLITLITRDISMVPRGLACR
jgi:hypothetical protein